MNKKFFGWALDWIWRFVSTPFCNWWCLRWITIEHLQIIVSLGKSQFWLIFMTHYNDFSQLKLYLLARIMPFDFKLIEMKGHLISLYEFKNILVSVLFPVTSGLLPVIEYESWWSGDNPGAIWIRRVLLGKIWWHNLISLILWCLIFRQLNFASTNCLVFQMKSSVLVSWQRPKQDIDTVLWTDQLSAIFTKRIFREFNSLISL